MEQPEGKKSARVTFACSTDFETRLKKLAKVLSTSRPGDEISPSCLAHKLIKEGMDREIGRLLLMKNDIDNFLHDFK